MDQKDRKKKLTSEDLYSKTSETITKWAIRDKKDNKMNMSLFSMTLEKIMPVKKFIFNKEVEVRPPSTSCPSSC